MTENVRRRKTIESAIANYLIDRRLILKGSEIVVPAGGYTSEHDLWAGRFQLGDTAIRGTFSCQFKPLDDKYFYVFHKPAYTSLNITFNKREYAIR